MPTNAGKTECVTPNSTGRLDMQSTRVGTRLDGLPIYAVHPVGTQPPALGPCLPDCTRCPS